MTFVVAARLKENISHLKPQSPEASETNSNLIEVTEISLKLSQDLNLKNIFFHHYKTFVKISLNREGDNRYLSGKIKNPLKSGYRGHIRKR